MNTSIAIPLSTAVAAQFGAAQVAITHSQTFPTSMTLGSCHTVDLPGFDASLGNLSAARLYASMSAIGEIGLENTHPTSALSPPEQPLFAVAHLESALCDNVGVLSSLVVIPLGSPPTSVYPAYDGSTDCQGSSFGTVVFDNSVNGTLAHEDLTAPFAVEQWVSDATGVVRVFLDAPDAPSFFSYCYPGFEFTLAIQIAYELEPETATGGGTGTGTWVPPTGWTNLRSALGGTHGEPSLLGSGDVTPDSEITLILHGALENTTTTLVVGLSNLLVPFKGGTMVPSLDVLIFGLPTSSAGDLVLTGDWPVGIPVGLTTYFQHWITDPGGPQGYVASNGISATAP